MGLLVVVAKLMESGYEPYESCGRRSGGNDCVAVDFRSLQVECIIRVVFLLPTGLLLQGKGESCCAKRLQDGNSTRSRGGTGSWGVAQPGGSCIVAVRTTNILDSDIEVTGRYCDPLAAGVVRPRAGGARRGLPIALQQQLHAVPP